MIIIPCLSLTTSAMVSISVGWNSTAHNHPPNIEENRTLAAVDKHRRIALENPDTPPSKVTKQYVVPPLFPHSFISGVCNNDGGGGADWN